MKADLDYGNARVRALKSRLLTAADYTRLVELTSEQLIAALADTAYKTDLEAEMFRGAGRRLLHATFSAHLARTLATVRSCYQGDAHHGLAMLTSDWDLANLLTIVRGQWAGAPADEIEALLVPAGSIDGSTLEELARQPSPRATLELMMAWGVPTRRVALRLLAASRGHGGLGAHEAIEHELLRAHAADIDDALSRKLWPQALQQPLRSRIDKSNIMLALRSLQARELQRRGGAAGEQADLPGGTIRIEQLERVAHAGSRDAAVATLLAGRDGHVFAAALAAWVADGDLGRLDARMDEAIARSAIRGFVDADPLSVAVPVAFVFAQSREVRWLRLIAEAAAGRLPREAVRGSWLAA